MAENIYLIHDDHSLVKLRQEPYNSESLLQELLARYPDLLSADDGGEPRRWLLIDREAGIPHEEGGGAWFSIDHLFLDQDAVPTLVEVKRASDLRLRREVVGQMLDYAANAVVFGPADELRHLFEKRCQREELDPGEALREALGDIDEDELWTQARTNLQAGRVRMIFVADLIPPELRRIVEFLNQQMQPAEVLAVEVRQFVGESLRTLVPRTFGQSAGTEQRKKISSSGGRQWDEASFFATLAEERSPEVVEVAQEIYDWCREKKLGIWFGRGATLGGWVPSFTWNDVRHQLFDVWTTGMFETFFQWYAYKKPFEDEALRRELLRRFNEIPGVELPANAIHRRPSIDLQVFVDPESRRQLFAVLEWVLDTIRGE